MRVRSGLLALTILSTCSSTRAATLTVGQPAHPVLSTAGCSSLMIERKVAADLAANKASPDASDLMDKNHCSAIIGDDAHLGPPADDSTATYRMLQDQGGGIGLFIVQTRYKDPQYSHLNDNSVFYAPIVAFTAP